ncbi:hypothetical protein NQ314_010455 [Rhamnusium bicolor]|uniref:Uncharacterized protein n=1 Tax=Rhamnusium bicolor TaxID=1586634 RepID=A0AAV8XQI7_9CUCU|nr:hypothetical protein NQ314_010455 [Rhamnusium bicolor]
MYLAYLADISGKFNEFNLQLQGFDKNIFNSTQKIKAFYKKLSLWKNSLASNNLTAFSCLIELISEGYLISRNLKSICHSHLA